MLVVVLSMIGCCMLIRASYDKWDESPVIVTFSEKMIPIKNIPLPAVTICSEIKSKKELFDYAAALSKWKFKEPPLFGLTVDEYNFECSSECDCIEPKKKCFTDCN